jgi:putative membrane protein
MRRLSSLLVLSLLVAVLAVPASAEPPDNPFVGSWVTDYDLAGGETVQDDRMDGEMSAWGWTMMVVFSTLFAALLATAIWALYSYTTRTRPGGRRASPEELLAELYARGDITTEEYQERLDTLRG